MSRAAAAGWGTRLTFSGDVSIVDDGDWRQSRVRLASEFEPAPGLSLRATVGDHRNVRLGMVLRGAWGAVHGGEAREDSRIRYQSYALSLHRGTVGNNVMYFETGQGSALSAGAHHGVDQQTCEARAYAVARHFQPLLVNTVVGFIGPEYLYDGKQIIRAGLEDHFCGKLLGLPMGVDVCYTNHAEADQDDMDTLLTLLGVAGINFIMGVPGADDIMLNYQSTSFHDALYLRRVLGKRRAPEFEEWLERMGITDTLGQIRPQIPGRQPLLTMAAGLGAR